MDTSVNKRLIPKGINGVEQKYFYYPHYSKTLSKRVTKKIIVYKENFETMYSISQPMYEHINK